MTNPNLKQHTSSICIVGAGFVGATAAYCVMQQDVSADITLVDINDDMAEGQTLDLEDTQFISQTKIHHGLLKDAGKADIIVITAGVRQRPNEPRSALLERNAVVMRSIVNGMKPIREDAIILVVSNPCDVLTYVVWKASGLPSAQVFGSGTFLDSMRLRSYLSKELEANENSIHAFVLGEHGDNQFIAWSAASVGCSKLISGNFEKPFSKEFREKVEYETMRKAYSIIKLKGATYYGIASCISSLCQSVLFNEKYIRPVSVYDDEKGVVLSWPCTIGRRGVEKIMPLQLNESEQKKLSHAVNELQKSISVVSKT